MVLGSDMGDREGQLQEAIRLLGNKVGKVTAVSKIYETEPWGFNSEASFLNQAVAVVTDISPSDALNAIKAIEKEMGRTTSGSQGYTSRPIDIDIIYIGTLVIATDELTVPHPLRNNRRFVLAPLVDIAPDFKDPLSEMTVQAMLQCCDDDSRVEPFRIAI